MGEPKRSQKVSGGTSEPAEPQPQETPADLPPASRPSGERQIVETPLETPVPDVPAAHDFEPDFEAVSHRGDFESTSEDPEDPEDPEEEGPEEQVDEVGADLEEEDDQEEASERISRSWPPREERPVPGAIPSGRTASMMRRPPEEDED